MENIKEQRFQNVWRVTPSVEVEGLEARERERVVRVIKEESVLPATGPTMQTFFQLTNDVGEVRYSALAWFQYVYALNCVPQPAFLFEIEPVTLIVTLDEHAEKAEQELQILFGRRKRERVDREIPCFLADVQVG